MHSILTANQSSGDRAVSSPTRFAVLAAGVLLSALSCGCQGPYEAYKVVMTPHGDSLERSIRARGYQVATTDSQRDKHEPQFAPSRVDDQLRSIYEVWDSTRASPFVASRRFANVPDDIGTRGHYAHRASPLGDGFSYDECIRGMADPEDWVARRLSLADTLAAAVAAWLRFELVPQPEWPRVAESLEPELQKGARTIASVTLLTGPSDSTSLGWLLGCATEHPLWALLLVPALGDPGDGTEIAGEADPYLVRARADLAHRLGLRSPGEQARALGFLADHRRTASSFRAWSERVSVSRAVDSKAFERCFEAMTDDPREKSTGAIVDVELRVPEEPFLTNGAWSESLHCVQWRGWCAWPQDRDAALPLACAALWSVPDSVAQRRLFGDVVLAEADLFDFADWYAALPPPRQAEWDRMLLRLRPGRTEPVARFRFRGESGTTDTAARGRARILRALSKPDANRTTAAAVR